jgi:hypothetical protein
MLSGESAGQQMEFRLANQELCIPATSCKTSELSRNCKLAQRDTATSSQASVRSNSCLISGWQEQGKSLSSIEFG